MADEKMTLSGNTMEIKDAISGALAECCLTIHKPTGDEIYNFMQATNVTANFNKTKTEVPILGRTAKGHKASGWNGTGSARFHYNTSIFREMMSLFAESGEDVYFDMVIKNADPTSNAGGQQITLKDCNIDGGILAKFDASAEYLEEDMNFTFEGFSIDTPFSLLKGMKMDESL